KEASASMSVIEAIADILADTTFSNAGSKALDSALDARRFLVACCLKDGEAIHSPASQRRALHWPLAFPHLQWPRGFDAIVANPPFLGSQEMNSRFGEEYRSFLVQVIANGRKGKADLVGYFALRIADLGKSAGFLATNSICQGDTLDVCLKPLIPEKFHVARAWRSLPWPNKAGVFISKIWLTDVPVRRPILEGAPVQTTINTELYSAGGVEGTARPLAENRGLAHQGYQVIAAGLQLGQADANRLLADPGSAGLIRKFVNGISLHAHGPGFKPGAYCIDFGTVGLKEAQRAEAAFEYVESNVKKEVLAKGKSYLSWKDRWWQFWSPRPEMREALADLDRCFALVRTSKVMLPVQVQAEWCLSDSLIVFALDRWADFAVLSSAHHWWWALSPPGTGGSSFKSDPRYTTSVAFETFPRPYKLLELELIGTSLHEAQECAQNNRLIGLKALTNLVNDPECKDTDVEVVRAAYVANDFAISQAYALTLLDNVELAHDFYDCGQLGTRFTISPEARRRITDILLEENFRRFVDSEDGKGACLETGPDGVTRLRLQNGSLA
ncbi:DNA methyltransferase, partial [Cyanobium sp. A2C-AMD]|uniref:DNA methyltransferase n=1 Tax=Cyanobium sp. A2C-AMD TaxID=2823695 RepID=UPI0020CFC423